MVHHAVGYDAAKNRKGRKRHLVVDTLGSMMGIIVTAANVPERTGGQAVLSKFQQLGEVAARVYLVWVDGRYSGPKFLHWAMDTLGWMVQVVLRPQAAHGFTLLKKRWIVERTFGWWRWSRRLVQDYDKLPAHAEAMLQIAMIRIMLKRLA